MPNKYLRASLDSWTLCLYKVSATCCELCVVCIIITATQRLEMSLNGMYFSDHLFIQREKDKSKEHCIDILDGSDPPESPRINTINSLSLQNLLWSRVLIFRFTFWGSEGVWLHSLGNDTCDRNVSSWIGSMPSQDSFQNISIFQSSISARPLCDWAIT